MKPTKEKRYGSQGAAVAAGPVDPGSADGRHLDPDSSVDAGRARRAGLFGRDDGELSSAPRSAGVDREAASARFASGLRQWASGLGETAGVIAAFVVFGVVWALVLGLAVDWIASLRVTP